jgi:uncharacterized protein
METILIIIVTSAIQSLFGVGVLLFGTPLLLLIGNEYLETLLILLPLSIAINLIQITKGYHFIDIKFYKKVLTITIPLIMIFLLIGITTKINFGYLVGIFLVFVALKDCLPLANRVLEFIGKYQKLYLALMGMLHGLTNLGGSLLTAIVYSKEKQKEITRATIAVCYATFGIFQVITLLMLDKKNLSLFVNNINYLLIGLVIYFIVEKVIYSKINNQKYSIIFSGFMLLTGFLLIVKNAA